MLKNYFLDMIFPRFCLGCRKELNFKRASFICEACFDKIILNGSVQCHICDSRINCGVCRRCRRKTNLLAIYSAGKYQDPVLREAVHRFKYSSIESLKKPLAELMVNYLKKENLIENLRNSVLTPIPLTWRRKLSRGFNQSELLAKELSPVLNCPVVNLLKRKKFSSPQARIADWQKRKENISGAFIFKSAPRQRGGLPKKVILVDDVSTSGATLEEAARVVKEAGAKEVYGLVVARG